MKYGKHFKKQLKDPAFLKALAQEALITDIQEEICRLMEENDVSRTELAKLMGKSKGFITQILNSGRNLTLRTIADIFAALGAEIDIKAREKKKETAQHVVLEKLQHKFQSEFVVIPTGAVGLPGKTVLDFHTTSRYRSIKGDPEPYHCWINPAIWRKREEKNKVSACG